MRLATVKASKGLDFQIAPKGSSKFISWDQIKSKFKNDKLVQSVFTFDDYIRLAESVHPMIQKSESEWARLVGTDVPSENFAKAFSPLQFRDFYCFEEHVKNGRRSRGLEMLSEWYEFPVFYYSNHMSINGSNDPVTFPQGCQSLDFELEIGAVVGKKIRNATVEQARDAILGYCLVNDWTARDFQSAEMKLNMGPHKGKDFCTSFGPYIITPDEFSDRKKGKAFDVEVELLWNGTSLVKNNWSKIQFSFEDMLVRASKNCEVHPGELLATGTVGMGCLMEHNLDRPEKKWLQIGDTIELRMQPDLVLHNKIEGSKR